MYSVVACIVIYNNKLEEIELLIKEFFEEDISQKLVIVDNSNTGYLKNDILKINSTVDYIINENIGYGSANNLVIEKYKEKSKYYIVMNPDIFIKMEDLKKLIKYADFKGEFGIIMPKVIYPNGDIQYLCKLLPSPFILFFRRFFQNFEFMKKIDYKYELHETEYNKNMRVPVLSGCFMFCHYGNLIKESGFDSRYFLYMEDVDLSRKMYKYGNFFYPDLEIIHGFGKASFKSLKMTIIHIKSAFNYFNKWGWFFDEERKKINKKENLYT